MDLRINFCQSAAIPPQNVKSKNAMRTRGDLIERSGVDPANIIAHHQVVDAFLLILAGVSLHILHLQVGILILHKDYLRPVLDICLSVIFVKQVVSILVVDLDEGHAEGVFVLGGLGPKLREYIG